MLLVIHIISLEYGYPICIFGKTSSKLYGNPENPEKSSEEDYKRLYYTKDTKKYHRLSHSRSNYTGPNQPSGRNQAASSTMSSTRNTSGSSSSRPTFNPPFLRPANPSSPTASEHLATSTPIHGTTTSTRRRNPMPNLRSTRQRTDIPSMSTLYLSDDPLEDMFPTSSTSSRSQSDLEIALNLSRRRVGRPTEELGVARMDNFNSHR